MAIDIFANEGTTVQFAIVNNGVVPLTYRYCVDCTTFDTGTPSSVMVQESSYAGTYMFRYAHLNVSSGVPSRASGWTRRGPFSLEPVGSRFLGRLAKQVCAMTHRAMQSRAGQTEAATNPVGQLTSAGYVHPILICTKERLTAPGMGACRRTTMVTAFSRHMARPYEATFPAA